MCLLLGAIFIFEKKKLFTSRDGYDRIILTRIVANLVLPKSLEDKLCTQSIFGSLKHTIISVT